MAAALYRCCKLIGRRVVFVPCIRPPVSSFGIVEAYRIHPVVPGRAWYSSGRGPGQELDSSSHKGFVGKFVENLRQDIRHNQEMKDSLKKFREEARKLEESDALQQARRKYKSIEAETVRTSEVLKNTLGSLADTVKEGLKEVGRSDVGKKIGEGVAEAAKLGQAGPFRAISQSVQSMAKEMDMGDAGPYRAPPHLRKRSEFSSTDAAGGSPRAFEANEEATEVVLHKDSKWYQQWRDFKDNNAVFNRLFEAKAKYDESDNALVRASRVVTDTIASLFSGTDMSKVLTVIQKSDPDFDQGRFLKQCKKNIIPNILEAMVRGELDVLKDWCYEAVYSRLAHPIQRTRNLGLLSHSKILDIDNVDLAMGKIMDQGPVLIITFQAQVVDVIRSPRGDVVEGDPEKVLRMSHVWALCRDQEELDPDAAWRLLDLQATSTEQVF